jgi:protein-S-isoprenylcysteine O-methyltransferase Ste14
MDDDKTFRAALLIAIALCAPGAVYGRLRSFTNEKLDRWQEGAVILFGLRLGGVPLFLGCVAWLIDAQWMAWSALELPAWLRWCGIAMVCCSGALVAWTFHNLGTNLTDTVVTRRDHRLVTSGPYRFVRHPFYVAFVVGIVGVSVAMTNWFIAVAALIPIGFLAARTDIEEAKLIERFGDDYREYMRRVGRFVPRIGKPAPDDKPVGR